MYWGNEPFRISIIGPIEPSLFYDWQMPGNRDMPIELAINSEGGDVVAALGIADLIRKHRGGCTAIVRAGAVCYSAATIIFAAASLRRAHISSRFLIHPVEQPGETRWSAAAHRQRAAALENMDQHLFRALAVRCGRPVRAIEAAASEIPMTAMTAQTLGLCHEVEW